MLLKSWENLHAEVLNQKMCRMVLGVHKRCSRLATIGELGRYPLLVSALKHSLKYEWQIQNQDQESIVNMAYREMADMPQLDTWYTRVQSIKTLLGVTPLYGTEYSVNMSLGRKLKSNFDRFWLDQINELKIGSDDRALF